VNRWELERRNRRWMIAKRTLLPVDGSEPPLELAELQAIGSCVLDPAMAETSSEVLDQFVRSLPAHIGHNRPSLVSDKNKDAPGGTTDERTTP
jgi:hypothetical protein